MTALSGDVAAIVRLFDESDLSELSVEQGERKLFLRKGEHAAPAPHAEVPEPSRLAPVNAHMVGVFYWSRDKAAKPPVVLGQALNQGQVIGFVEAMGIMNELEAPVAGRIVEIAAASGQAVEYGQPILVLEPD